MALFLGAAIGLIVDYFVPGWGRPVVLTLGIFGCLVVFCRSVWGTAFWTVAFGTFALNFALVIHFKATINELPLPILFLWAAVEIVVIGIVLGLVFPDKRESPLQR